MFCKRIGGKIVGYQSSQDADYNEEIAEDHIDILTYRGETPELIGGALAKEELKQLDLASIRSMREWMAAQPSAPQILKDHEAQAIDARVILNAI